jgi:CubicO group peptidase (beta-lactamase class C family)
MLIVKGGKLVFEEYMNGWDPPRLHRMQSVSKSFTSTMVGFAVQEGLIENIHDPLFEYLPEYASAFDEDKKKIQIEHLLTMSAGFEWNEFDTYFAKPEDCDSHKAEASDDYIEYVLEKPLSDEPGSRWYYNSGYPNMLGYIIEKKSGMNLLEFSYQHLFETLGIERAYWHAITGENRPSCAGGLWLTSRDMAKYGELYLRGGKWKGRQVLPASWVEASTQSQIDTGVEGGFGFLWWRPPVGGLDLYLASGTGGQYVVCIPTFDAVVVTTAQFNTNKKDVVNELLIKYVVPALAAAM